MRKRTHAPENHDRWLISYADFITLLFAFFVVMYASSQSDRSRAGQISESLRKALERPMLASLLGGTVNERGNGNAMHKGPGGAQQATPKLTDSGVLAELLPSMNVLERELKAEIAAGKMQVSLEGRGLVVSLREAAFFPSAEDAVLPKAYSSVQKVADAIRKLPNPVRLEGHTDGVPIHNSRFHSNWELSAARSIAMLELFTGRFGLPHTRFAVAGYADTAPIASNNEESGRALNRRVDIVVLNKAGLAGEPHQ